MKKLSKNNPKDAENNEIGQRIELIRSIFFGGDNGRMAQALETHYTNVPKLIKGVLNINRQQIENLLRNTPDLNPDWFLLGRGDIHRQTNINVNGTNNGTATQNIENSELVQSQQRTIEKQHDTIAELVSMLRDKK